MQYQRCECGKSELWNSGEAVYDCEGCEDCETTFSKYKNGHKKVIPHDPKPQYNRDTGKLSHYICKRCFRRVEGSI